jgi:hypothetical protein
MHFKGVREIPNLKVPRQYPFAVLVKVGSKEDNILINEAGKSAEVDFFTLRIEKES